MNIIVRAVGRSENMGGTICPPVEIGLTDLPKSGVACGPPALPVPSALIVEPGTSCREKLTRFFFCCQNLFLIPMEGILYKFGTGLA